VFDRLERLANSLLDNDWTWWPFIFLRPRRREAMNTRRVLWMTVYFGPMFGLAVMLAVANLRLYTEVQIDLRRLVLATIGAFAVYRMTFAVLWNRRASRLRALRPDPSDP
jgi:hypothetical protein